MSQRVLAGSFKLMVNLLVEDWSQVYIWWIWWWTWCLAVVLVGRLVWRLVWRWWRDLPRLFEGEKVVGVVGVECSTPSRLKSVHDVEFSFFTRTLAKGFVQRGHGVVHGRTVLIDVQKQSVGGIELKLPS